MKVVGDVKKFSFHHKIDSALHHKIMLLQHNY